MFGRRQNVIAAVLVVLTTCAANGADPQPAEVLPPALPATDATSGPQPILEPLPTRSLAQITSDVLPPAGTMPDDAAARLFDAEPTLEGNRERGFAETVYFWQASNLAHRRLYFEQAYVERYGYNYRCLQPVVSGAEFYADFAVAPIRRVATIGRPYTYVLGPERPGSRGTPYPRRW